MWTLLKLTFLCRSRGRRAGDEGPQKAQALFLTFFPLPQCYCCVCVEMNRQHNTGILGNRSPRPRPVSSSPVGPVQVQKRFTAPHPQVSLTAFKAWFLVCSGDSEGRMSASDSLEEKREAKRRWIDPREDGAKERGRVRDGAEAEAAKEQAPRRRAFW